MAKKHKSTAEFSPRAMRIYKIAQKGVAARSNQQSVLRAIDRELDTVKVGSPDPKLKKEIGVLEGQVADADKVIKEHIGTVEQLEADHKVYLETAKGEVAGFESELKNAQEVIQEGSKENKALKEQVVMAELAVRGLEEKVAELESAGSDPADGPPYKGETTDTPDSDPDASLKVEGKEDPKGEPKEEGKKKSKGQDDPNATDPPSQPGK